MFSFYSGVKVHWLKCWPEYFNAVVSGRKRFEIRRDDRGFTVGDFLVLKEYDPVVGYTGRAHVVMVDYVIRNPEFVKEGFCVMSVTEYLKSGYRVHAVCEVQEGVIVKRWIEEGGRG